jgi:histidinol dehydrogenase
MVRPLERVGVYIPGGKASYPSSLLMNVIPAQVAGVKEIVVVSPTPRGGVNPFLLLAAQILGITGIYRVGGAQAVGALAYGTRSVPRVDKIVGPGNIYVATAKRLVFGEVDIDMIAGPSEILIVSDGKGSPSFLAADLLSQAEHDEMALPILITTSSAFARKVQKEVSHQLRTIEESRIAAASVKRQGLIIVVNKLKEALDLANDIAPEHLELAVEKPWELLGHVRNAGAVFLGHYTPEAVGDYIAGPNHTLPTGGTARFFSPLSVSDFLKKTSVLSFSQEVLDEVGGHVIRCAEKEGLNAHARAVKVRLNHS